AHTVLADDKANAPQQGHRHDHYRNHHPALGQDIVGVHQLPRYPGGDPGIDGGDIHAPPGGGLPGDHGENIDQVADQVDKGDLHGGKQPHAQDTDDKNDPVALQLAEQAQVDGEVAGLGLVGSHQS